MANFQFNVDTSPMAGTVETAHNHIKGVALAVTTMEAAVIATERNSSKTICENVDNGFYMLVKSQISQKAVAAKTEMLSKEIIMLQLSKALDSIKQQMEKDYNMITERYVKLFNSLNKALELRVKELDRPAMQLAEIKKTFVFDKLKDDSSMLLSISSETLPVSQTALSGKLKQKTRDTLLTLSDSVIENSSYSEKVESILIKNENDFAGNSDYRYLPVIYFATDSFLNQTDSIDAVYTTQSDAWQNAGPVVSEITRVQNDLQWAQPEAGEKTAIRKEFIRLCEKETSDERLLNEITRLFDESSWEVLQE